MTHMKLIFTLLSIFSIMVNCKVFTKCGLVKELEERDFPRSFLGNCKFYPMCYKIHTFKFTYLLHICTIYIMYVKSLSSDSFYFRLFFPFRIFYFFVCTGDPFYVRTASISCTYSI